MLITVLLIPSATFAKDFEFQSMDDEILINKDGSIHVSETIKVKFLIDRHGIYRVIPVNYFVRKTDESKTYRVLELKNIQVHDQNGQEIEFFVSDADDVFNIRVGSKNQTVTGEKTYIIDYDVFGALNSFEFNDELYWNVTGTEWESAPLKASATVAIEDANLSDAKIYASCYTGKYGSVKTSCQYENLDNSIVFNTTNNFLTFAVGWSNGLVNVPEPVYKRVSTLAPLEKSNLDKLSILLPFIALFLMYINWRKYGKDPKGRKTIVPQYDPPKGIRPTEMATLARNKIQPKFLSAAIIDFAVRGYLIIHEDVKKRLGPDKKVYSFEKLKEAGKEMHEWEKLFFQAIFSGKTKKVSLKLLKLSLPKRLPAIKKEIFKQLVSDGFYVKSPSSQKTKWIIKGVVLTILSFLLIGISLALFGSPLLGIMGMLSGVIVIVFGIFMIQRTEKGVEMVEYSKGLKMFLSVAEKYRLEWQERKNMFEKFLPFAMVFGVTKKWSKALKIMDINPEKNPEWYIGVAYIYTGAFDMVEFTSAMDSVVRAVQSTAIAPSGSASSGGGFSGGGFGGGGGGSW